MKWSRTKRGLWWTGGALLLLAITGLLWNRGVNEEWPTVTIPTPILPSPNAYDEYLKANRQVIGNPINQSGTSTDAQLVAALPRNLPALKTFRAGMAYPFLNPPQRSYDALPSMAEFRGLARLLLLEGRVKGIQKDYGGAANAYLDCIRLGTDVPRGGPLIPALVGIACETMGRRYLWELTDKLNANDARAAAKRLEKLNANRFPYADTMREEKWLGQASLTEILRKGITFNLVSMLSDSPPLMSMEWIRTYIALRTRSRKRILEDYSAYLDAIIVQTRQPYSPNTISPSPPKDPINRALLHDVLRKAQFKDWDVRVQAALLTATLALRAHYLEKGDYPASLNALVSEGYLASLPQDPFAGNSPLQYRRVSAKKYILYSVGPDGKDDGGKPIDSKQGGGTPKHWVEAGMVGDFVPRINTY